MLQQKHDYSQNDDLPEDEIETCYLYIYDDDPEQRRWPKLDGSKISHALMQALAMVMLAGFCVVQGAPNYQIQIISVPALLLPVQHLEASAPIVATGMKTILATRARGWLTITNGSSLIETIPSGFTVESTSGAPIATDQRVTVPASDGERFGRAIVPAYAVVAGLGGNIEAYSVSTIEGTSLYIKNLAAFTGGQDARTIHVVQESDRQTALTQAKARVEAKKPTSGLLAQPCTETVQQAETRVTVQLVCQYVIYHVPAGARVLAAHVEGNTIVVRLQTIVPPV